MPLNFKKYSLSAKINAKHIDMSTLASTYETGIEITMNDLVFSKEECAKIVGQITELFLVHADQLEQTSTTVNNVSVETKDEQDARHHREQSDFLDKAEKDYNQGDATDDDLRAYIVRTQKELTYNPYKYGGEILDVLNDEMAKKGWDYEPFTKEEFKKDDD